MAKNDRVLVRNWDQLQNQTEQKRAVELMLVWMLILGQGSTERKITKRETHISLL